MVLNKVIVLDGGFATQLSVHVGSSVDGDPLWSARFNSSDPAAIIKTHYDFLKDGANIIITNTYQASVEGYVKYLGLDVDRSVDLIKRTVLLAQKARQQFLDENPDLDYLPLIAASIGPFGAHLHDGSEYTGAYADYVSIETLKKWHRIRMDAVIEAGVDCLAVETIPCALEAQAIVELMNEEYADTKFWLSFQCRNDRELAHGENFAETCLDLWENQIKVRSNLLALGVNCLHPKNVSPLFKSLNGNRPEASRIPLIVYPNSGEVYDVQSGWSGREDCVPLDHYVPEWINIGAKIIGGCCRTYSRDITRIKQAVEKHNK